MRYVVLLLILIAGCTGLESNRVEFDITELEYAVHKEVNTIRANNSLPPLKLLTKHSDVARAHSEDMVKRNYYSHENLENELAWDRMRRVGIYYGKTMSENLHQETRASNVPASQVGITTVESWLASTQGHRENMLDPQWEQTGIGIAIDNSNEAKIIVTQLYFHSEEKIEEHRVLESEIKKIAAKIEEIDVEMESLLEDINERQSKLSGHPHQLNIMKTRYNDLNAQRTKLVNEHSSLSENK